MITTRKRFAWYPLITGNFKLTKLGEKNRLGSVRKFTGIAWLCEVEEMYIFNYSTEKDELLSRRT